MKIFEDKCFFAGMSRIMKYTGMPLVGREERWKNKVIPLHIEGTPR